MSDMPERIWVNQKNLPWVDPWPEQQITDTDVEYIRLDVAQAMVAAAYEAAAKYASGYAQGFADPWVVKHFGLVSGDIRALTPADAQAALDRRDRKMRAEGMREAADVCTRLALDDASFIIRSRAEKGDAQ